MLEVLPNDGKATITIGADKVSGNISASNRVFFNWLYSHYNVTSHFEVSGNLYSRQSAGWPIRVLSVHGRKESDKHTPVSGSIERADTWEQVYENYKDSMDSIAEGSKRRGEATIYDAPRAEDNGSLGKPVENKDPESSQGDRSEGIDGSDRERDKNKQFMDGRDGEVNRPSRNDNGRGHYEDGPVGHKDSSAKPEKTGLNGTVRAEQQNDIPLVDAVDRASRNKELVESDFQAPYDSGSADFKRNDWGLAIIHFGSSTLSYGN